MTIFQILGGMGAIIGILSAFGFAYVYLRGSVDKGTITSLQGSVSALQIESDLKDKKIEKLEVANEHLAQEVSTLRGIVTNAEEVKAIHALLDKHHAETTGVLQKIEKNLHDQIEKGFKQ